MKLKTWTLFATNVCLLATITFFGQMVDGARRTRAARTIIKTTHQRSVTIKTQKRYYEPNWKSLDSRPLPVWYDDAKIGIFIHWGVYSVPSFGSEWFWWNWRRGDNKTKKKYEEFIKANYPPKFKYADLAREFRAEFWNLTHWTDLFEKAGAKYVVLTSKHHDGFTLWPSEVSWNWNAVDVGPKRDLVGAFATAIRNRTKIRFGLYYSLFEWFNPLYLRDNSNKFQTQTFVKKIVSPQLRDIVTTYKPEVIWSDGEWEAPDSYWNSTHFLAWLYNESPVGNTVLVNDRWGDKIKCKHGDFYTCQDRYNPGVLVKHKWENAFTLDKKSWGFRRTMSLKDVMSIEELLFNVVSTVSCNGNVLINIGPTKEGTIAPIFEERLVQLGDWLKINGEAIYKTRPWTHQNDTLNGNVWYTSNNNTVYGILFRWPTNNTVILGDIVSSMGNRSVVTMLGYPSQLKWSLRYNGVRVELPILNPLQAANLKWAWSIKFLF